MEARLTVDLRAISGNWRAVVRAARGAEVAGVVKADAYGTGIASTAAALWDAGCRTFFVALPGEGADLRPALPEATIYVLAGYLPSAGALYRHHRLAPVLGDPEEVDAWLKVPERDGNRPALHVDTGMNRLGLHPEAALALAADPGKLEALAPALLVSHFACADDHDHPLNRRQIEAFATLRRSFPGLRGSLANSAGITLGPEAHHDLVRPGIALYGGGTGSRPLPGLSPVVTVEAMVLTVRDVPSGQGIGYGCRATTVRPSRVAILACGYADGYPRRLGFAGAHVAFAGLRAPLIGAVSMDLMAVDVTDLPEGAVRRGDMAELIGPTVPLAEVASRAETIDYEILTNLGSRFERRHRS